MASISNSSIERLATMGLMGEPRVVPWTSSPILTLQEISPFLPPCIVPPHKHPVGPGGTDAPNTLHQVGIGDISFCNVPILALGSTTSCLHLPQVLPQGTKSPPSHQLVSTSPNNYTQPMVPPMESISNDGKFNIFFRPDKAIFFIMVNACLH